MSSDLGVTIVCSEDSGPLRPGIIRGARNRWLRQKFKVRDRLGPVSHRGTNTVVSSIASSNHNDVLAFRLNVVPVLELRIKK